MKGGTYTMRHRVDTGRSRRDYSVPDAAARLDHISGGIMESENGKCLIYKNQKSQDYLKKQIEMSL